MTSTQKLFWVKLVHTAIWVFYNLVIGYFVYAVVRGKIDRWLWICLGLILFEGLVLLVFRRHCPLTLLARRYSSSARHNFDIFLPEGLARYNQLIYTTIVLVALLILFYRLLR